MVGWGDINRFVRCISRTHLNRAEADYLLSFVKRAMPWDNLVALANMQGVAGFFYYHMKDLGLLHLLPKSALRNLKNNYSRTQKRSLAILSEAEAISSSLEQARFPVIALQGVSLITTVYGDPGLRELGDMDLMVKPQHKQRLKELLYQAGYMASYPFYPDLLYKNDILIDIHTHVLNLERIQSRRFIFPEDLSPMWEKATPLFNEHNGLLILDPYDNFIALAAHALKHSYARLIWLTDLHACLLKWAADYHGWKMLTERARFWGQERIALYGLILVEKIFKLKVPFWVKRELGVHRLNTLERHLLRLSLRGFSSTMLCNALWIINIKGVGDKLRFVKETVFPKEEIMAQIFPDGSGSYKSLAYAKRTIDIVTMLVQDLHEALTLSFRAIGK